MAQWTFNASLARTSVTSNTILASLATLFTFFGSIWLLRERFTLPKLLFIAMSVAGAPARGLKLSSPKPLKFSPKP